MHRERDAVERRLAATGVGNPQPFHGEVGDGGVGHVGVRAAVGQVGARATDREGPLGQTGARAAECRVRLQQIRACAAECKGPLQHGEHLLGGGHTLGARVVVGAQPAQRQVRLGSEHEYEQRGAQVEVPGHQAQADRDGDERDRDRGDELQDQRGEERDAQRGERGRVGTVQ